MNEIEVLVDLLRKPGCEVSSVTREMVLKMFPYPEWFVVSRMLDEYSVDRSTGIRERRTPEERAVWRFDPPEDISRLVSLWSKVSDIRRNAEAMEKELAAEVLGMLPREEA